MHKLCKSDPYPDFKKICINFPEMMHVQIFVKMLEKRFIFHINFFAFILQNFYTLFAFLFGTGMSQPNFFKHFILRKSF